MKTMEFETAGESVGEARVFVSSRVPLGETSQHGEDVLSCHQ